MAEEKNEIRTFDTALLNKLNENTVSLALPKDFNKEKFTQEALFLTQENPDLLKYGNQLITGLLKGAVLGLSFTSKEAYLIPYGARLNYQTDYRGAKKLVKKYSIRPVMDVYAEIVRQGDEFKYWSDDEGQHYEFVPKQFNDGAVIGAFAVVKYADGGLMVDSMSLAELENTRKHSKASNSMAWKDFTTEMYKKTVLHRICKHVEIDFENPTQKSYFDSDMSIDSEEEQTEVIDAFEDAIETTAEVVE